jgi:hypothetical protein
MTGMYSFNLAVLDMFAKLAGNERYYRRLLYFTLSTFVKLAKLAARATPTLTSLYFSKICSLVKSVREF